MGCFNSTCAITNLPILAGDNAVLLFLKYNKSCNLKMNIDPNTQKFRIEKSAVPLDRHKGYTYSNDVWTLYAPPIFGKYNDYGTIENIEDSFVLEQLEKTFDNSINNIIESIASNSLFVNETLPLVDEVISTPIGFMLCHRWAYDLLTITTWKYDKKTFGSEYYMKKGIEFFEALSKVSKDKSFEDAVQNNIITNALAVRMLVRQKMNINRGDNIFFDHFDEFGGTDREITGVRQYIKLLSEKCLKDGMPSNEDIKVIADFITFQIHMLRMSKLYSPQVNPGQSQEYDIFKKVYEASLAHIKEKTKKKKEKAI